MQKKGLILCVDDEKIVLDSLKSQLKQVFNSQYVLETAESGDEALEILEEYSEDEGIQPALIISDMIMPRMKGSELLEKVHETYPNCQKILLTGQADKDDIVHTISKVKLYRYFSKPWDKIDLNMTAKEAVIAFDQALEIKKQRDELIVLAGSLEQKVKERTEELTRKNKMVMDSIEYAKRIQEGVLVDLSDVKVFLPEFFLFYKPLHTVSGDTYFFSKIDNKIVICVVDCTGHGVPGALMSMIAQSQLNRIINVRKETNPANILTSFHRGVVKSLNQHNNGIEDGMDASVSVFDTTTNELLFAGAKQPLVYVQNKELHYIKGGSLPIGGLVSYERSYENNSIKIDAETTLYMFSDGAIDQHGGGNDSRFMIKPFRELLHKLSDLPMDKQLKEIEQAIKKWQGDYKQTDDMLVVGFRLPPKV